MKKQLLGLIAGAAVFALPQMAFAENLSTKTLQLNEHTISTPQGFVHDDTTFFPIWYVMNGLNRLGIHSHWDGSNWRITTPSNISTDVSHVHPGTGNVHIYVNGHLIRNVTGITSQQTMHVPIWYLMQDLKRMNIRSNWNGVTWDLMTSTGNAEASLPVITPRAPGQNTRDEIVTYAKQFEGVAYRWGGTSPSGFDCSGFVQYVYGHFGKLLPRIAADQAQVGSTISKSSLQPGDLVFFNTGSGTYSHVGIYIGNDQFISATSSHGVHINNLNDPYYWGSRFTKATNDLS